MPSAALLQVSHERKTRAEGLIKLAVSASHSRLYLLLEGRVSVGNALLSSIAQMLDVVAVEKPCLDVVPLLETAGWTTSKVAALPDLSAVYCQHGTRGKAEDLVGSLQELRPSDLRHIRVELLPSGAVSQADADPETNDVQSSVSSLQGEEQYTHVAVGGTFDRLHAGHRILLVATALVSTSNVYIGVTGDKLLANKQHHALLEPYNVRRDAAIAYMQAVRPELSITGGALVDPKEPTAAATDANMQALVVSQETLPGAEAINKDRLQRGFSALSVVVVDLVGKGSKELNGEKLSSTALRARDAGKLP